MLTQEIEKWAEKLHNLYLEATKTLHPESYNPKAQKPYSELTEEQKEIDRCIAQALLELVKKEMRELEKVEWDKVHKLNPDTEEYIKQYDKAQGVSETIADIKAKLR